MRKSRFTEEQIVGILKEADRGGKVRELIRRHGISQDTFYRWKRKYGGMEVSDAKRLRALEEELWSEVVERRLVEGMKKAAYPPT